MDVDGQRKQSEEAAPSKKEGSTHGPSPHNWQANTPPGVEEVWAVVVWHCEVCGAHEVDIAYCAACRDLHSRIVHISTSAKPPMASHGLVPGRYFVPQNPRKPHQPHPNRNPYVQPPPSTFGFLLTYIFLPYGPRGDVDKTNLIIRQ